MSKTEPVLEEEYKGYLVKVFLDEDSGDSPRDWDNLGHLVCWHRRYSLGDKHEFSTPEDFERFAVKQGENIIRLPVFLYDHSGISISTSDTYPYNDMWDAGQVGWIYVTREDIRKEWGVKHVSQKLVKKTLDILRGEVKTYDRYLRGEVYGYTTAKEDATDEQVDSCWGFYEEPGEIILEAKGQVDWFVEDTRKKEELMKLEACS